jgi:microcin C transport system ATP-binding protein
MTEMLSVNNLEIAFMQSGKSTRVVNGIFFHIDRGEVVALVGESGSGKSVTALSTVSLLGNNANVVGSVKFDGREMVGASDDELRKTRGNDISFIFQEPMTSLNPLHTLEKQLRESLQLHQGLVGDAAKQRILYLLDRVGIHDPASRLSAYPHQLSGGQRQRIMIAMALANNPKLLIADEPTTALDVTIQAQILDLLVDLKMNEGMSMLFITHDLGIVKRIADRVYVMKDGDIVEHGRTQEVFQNPVHPYTQKLLSAHAIGAPDPVAPDAPIVAQAQNMRIWFPIQRGFFKRTIGHVKAVNDATFSVRQGETIGIVGESGSGKTTVAMAMMRLIQFEGSAVVMGQNVGAMNTRALRNLRAQMQIVFQDPFGSLSPRMTCAQIIAEGLEVHENHSLEERRALVREIMDEVGLDSMMMDRYPHEFSGGQRQRIAIARAMILRPKLVILDEPTSALDMTVQVQIVDLLRNLQKKYGLAYIFISHDLKVVRAMSHRVLVMKQGDVIETGDADQIFDDPQTKYAKNLVAAALG